MASYLHLGVYCLRLMQAKTFFATNEVRLILIWQVPFKSPSIALQSGQT